MAGGESSRFFPFNNIHKSFFSIAGKTILERTIESVKKLNPSEIILVLGSKDFEKEKTICESLPVFSDVKFVREESPLGQGDAILSAKELIKDDFFVINANQFNFHSIADSFIEAHEKSGDSVTVGITETDTPSKYGIVELQADKVQGVVEKPDAGKEPSNMRLVGVYLLSLDFLNKLAESPVTDYSLEFVLDKEAKNGKVGSVRVSSNLPSLKYPWDLMKLKDFILSEVGEGVDPTAVIEKTAILKGEGIFIGEGAHIYDFALIEGPCYIGKNAVVGAYSQVRAGTILENGTEIERYCDVKNSLIGEGTHIHSGFVGDSIIGKNCRVGAGFITANKRLDRSPVSAKVKGTNVETGVSNIGVFMGDGVKVGIRVSTMPGTIIGEGSVVFPGKILKGSYGVGSKVED